MAWPTTKATTTHLDAGTDDPGLARPQIKQNVDNVNSIIDEFGDVSITTPADGEVLTYVSANSRWENAAASGGGGGGGSVVYLGFNGSITTDGGSNSFYHFTELADTDNLATVTSGIANFATGTYIVDLSIMYDTASNVESNPVWRLRTGAGVGTDLFKPVKEVATVNFSSNRDIYQWGMFKFTVTSASADYILRFSTTTSTDPIDNITDCVVKLTKIS